MTRRPGENREDGFTLVELLVALGLFVLVLVVALGFFDIGWRRSADVELEAVRQGQARAALDELVADLRQAYTGDVNPPVASIANGSVTFYSPDRSVPFRLRRITYRRNAGRLERRVTTSTNTGGAPWAWPADGPWVVLADGLRSGAVFTGRDVTGAATTSGGAVRTVEIVLRVDVGRSGASPVRTFATTVHLRSTT